MKLGIFLPNWVGDVVMATPTLRALRNHFGPSAHLIGIMRPYVGEVLAGTSWLNESLFYDPRGKDSQRKGLNFVRLLRKQQFDVVVLLTNSLRTGVLARLSGARRRVGYARSARGWLLTDRLQAKRAGGKFVPSPVLDYYLELAYALGCPTESSQMELGTLPQDERKAEQLWRELRLPPGKEVVLLNSGGAFGAAKMWPTEYFARLARRVAVEWERTVLVLCGPAERDIARKITVEADHPRVLSLAEQELTLGLTKACVRRGALMVTTDSGPRHFAAAFDVPVITLFGPTHIAWSENHYAKAVHLQRQVPCGPCQQRVCPLGHHQCMRDLSVEEVFAAVSCELMKASSGLAA